MKKQHLDRNFILCLIVFFHLPSTFGSVLVEVGLLKYTSFKSCDNIVFYTKCDPFFKVCFETPPDNRCDWITTSHVDEENELQDILHGTSINPNPITQSFVFWERELTLRIQIWDANPLTQNKKVDEAVWFHTGDPNISLSTVFLQGTSYKATVTVYISIHCDNNYHGPSCSVFCEPTVDSYCDENGTAVCKPGVSPECSAITNLPTPPSSTIPASDVFLDGNVSNATRQMLGSSTLTTVATKSATNSISIYENGSKSNRLSGISSSQAYTHFYDTSYNKYSGSITLQQSLTKFTSFAVSTPYQSSKVSIYSTYSIPTSQLSQIISNGTQTEIYSPSKPLGSGLTAATTLQSEFNEASDASFSVHSTSTAYAEEIKEAIKTDAPTTTSSVNLGISPTATIKPMKSKPAITKSSYTSFNINQNVKQKFSTFEPNTSSYTKSSYFPPSYGEVLSTSIPEPTAFFSPSTDLSDIITPLLHPSPSNLNTKPPTLFETTFPDIFPTAVNGFTIPVLSSLSASANTINPTSVKISPINNNDSINSSAKLPYHLINTAKHVTPELPHVIKQIKDKNKHPDPLSNHEFSQFTKHRLSLYSSHATAVSASKVRESMGTPSGEGILYVTSPKPKLNDATKIRSPTTDKSRDQDNGFVFGIGISAGALLVIGICGFALWILSKKKTRHQSWPVPNVNDEFDTRGKTECREEEISLHGLPVIPESESKDNPTFESHDETELQQLRDFK